MAGDDIIDDAVVRISPDLTGFRKKLQTELKAATAGITAKVRLQADTTGWAASVRKELAARPQATAKVRLVADARGLQRSIDTALRQRGLPTGGAGGSSRRGVNSSGDDSVYQRIRTNIEKVQQAEDQSYRTRYNRARGYQEAIDRAHAQAISEQLRRTRTAEDTNTRLVAKAERERARLRSSTSRKAANPLLKASEGNGIIDLGGQGIKPSNIPIAALVALSPALLSIASSATLAASSVAAIGAAGIGAVAGVSALVIGFGRIREALTLRQQVRKEEQRATASTAENVAAERSRARAIVMGNRSVRDSVRSLADARRNAADADKAASQARADINVAYREAAQYVRDLREELSDLARQEQQDALDVASAKENLASVNNNYWATDLEKRQAALDVQKALDDQSDTKRDEVAKRKELNKLDRDGIGQSKQVLEARQRAADAERAAVDAHQAVTRAQEQVADALYNLAEAKRNDTAATTAASAASSDLAAKLAAMSPAAREMYYWFKNNEGMLDKLRSKMEQAVLPGFVWFLENIAHNKTQRSTLDVMTDSAARLGRTIGMTAGKLGELTEKPWFRKDMAKINKENEKSFKLLSKAALTLVQPFMRIIADSSPLFTRFSKWLLQISTQFAAFIDKADKNGSLVQWFKDAGDEAAKWGDVLGNLLGFLKSVFSASLPSGKDLVTRIGDAAALLNDWGKSARGQAQLEKFFQFFKDLDYRKIADFFGSIGVLVTTLKVFTFGRQHPFFALMAMFAVKYPEETAGLLSRIAGGMRDMLGWIGEHPGQAATALAILTAVRYAKNISIGMKLLGLGEGLAGKIAAAFGRTTTATMYVTAGVVNVAGGGLGGGGTLPGAPGGKPGAKPSRLPKTRGGKAALAVGAAAVAAGGIAAAKKTGVTPLDVLTVASGGGVDVDRKKGSGVHDWLKNQFGMDRGPTKAQVAAGEEKGAYGKVTDFIANRGGNLKGMSKDETLEFKYLMDDYLRLRKKSAAAAVDEARATGGIAAAMKEVGKQNTATSKTVTSIYENFGITNVKASQFASIVTGFPDKKTTELGVNTVAGKKHVADIQKDLDRAMLPHPVTFNFPAINQRKAELKEINAQIAKIVGTKEARIKVTAGSEVDKKLESLLIQQDALRRGVTLVDATTRYNKLKAIALKYAAGGPVDGYSPHSRADNIPAMLTADEYVQPVAAVKHYGKPMMDAIRTRRFPRLAEGGPVVWPFNMDISKSQTAFANPFSPPGDNAAYGPGVPVPGFGRWPANAASVHGHDSGMWRAIVRLVDQNKIPRNGYGAYNNRRTRRGGWSWHASGHAVDFAGYNQDQLAEFFMRRKPSVLELIHSTKKRNYGISRGHEHDMGSALWGQHRNHLHVAMNRGGLVPNVPMKSYDTGGGLAPGLTLAMNGTGRTETVRTATQEKNLNDTRRIDRRDLALLAQYIAAASQRPIHMDGRRVAEIVHGYNYLPGGV